MATAPVSAAPEPLQTSSESVSTPPEMVGRIRLDYLDGLRGIAAFYVTLSHAYTMAAFGDDKVSIPLSAVFLRAARWLTYGHYAVGVFIVLSGFCLMLPVANSQNRMLKDGLRGFAKRRAKRILPPYYIALAFAIGIVLVQSVRHPGSGIEETSAGNIISHLLLVQNLSSNFSSLLDGPLWSVAWEWQIYFLFALVLLPLWRRSGIIWTIILAFVLGYLPWLLLPTQSNFSWTSPWYIGLFAFGMGAAVVMCDRNGRYSRISSALVQNAALISMEGGFLLVAALTPQWLESDFYWLIDVFVGAFTALFILACGNKSNRSWLYKAAVQGLESRVLMTLGAFSYSLYLIHFPILQRISDILRQHHFSHYFQFGFLLFVGMPVCLALAYLFYLAFEHPFLSGHPTKTRQTQIAAVVSPAP